MIRQTASAINMLVSAYKSVLTHSFIKEFVVGGVKTLSKACAVPLLLSPVFITSFALAADPSSNPNEPIEITKGESYTDIVGQEVSIPDSDRSWISNTDGTFSGSWDSVNFSTSNNIVIRAEGKEQKSSTTVNVQSTGQKHILKNISESSYVYGIYNKGSDFTITSANDLSLSSENTYAGDKNQNTYGVFNSNSIVNSKEFLETEDAETMGISTVQDDVSLKIKVTDGSFSLNVLDKTITNNQNQSSVYGIYSSLINYSALVDQILGTSIIDNYDKTLTTSLTANSININVNCEGDKGGNSYGIYAFTAAQPPSKTTGTNKIDLTSNLGNIVIESNNGNAIFIQGSQDAKTEVNLTSAKNNEITLTGKSTISHTQNSMFYVENGKLNLVAENGINKLNSLSSVGQGILVYSGDVTLKGKENHINTSGSGIVTYESSLFQTSKGQYTNTTKLLALDGDNYLSSETTALNSNDNTCIELLSNVGNNIVKAYKFNNSNFDDTQRQSVIKSESGSISLVANSEHGENLIRSNNDNVSYDFNSLGINALYASNKEQNEGFQIYLKAHTNKLLGSVIAESASKIKISGTENYISSGSWHDINNVREAFSYAVTTRNYQNSSSEITIEAMDAGFNDIRTSNNPLSSKLVSERVVFAVDKGVINISGTSNIATKFWSDENAEGYQYNNTSMALVAAATENADDFVDSPSSLTDDERSHINLNYGKGSTITGDIVSGYGGDIQITEQASVSTASARAAAPAMTIRGNVLAGNGGKLNLELGEGSFWYGRADDYQDAGEDHGDGADNSFYNPAFSNEITSSGTVDVKLATNATWKMLGQSWLTSLENNGVVDLSNEFVSSTTDSEVSIENTHALTVQKLTGNGTFVMSLDHTDHANSDMLYAKNATGTYTLQLKEMPNGWENIDKDNALRFATLQGGATFNPEVEVVNQGAQNYKLLIEARPYEVNDKENAEYNGDGGLTLAKPGQDNVDDFFELSEDKSEEITTASLAKANEESVDALAEETADSAASEINNFVISQAVSTGLSDIGRTILNMSRANYANAVYMDTLNKRQGEARFGMSEDNGVWVRLRHDNIGKEDSFRTHNTMLELGYDIKNLVEGGQWHTGIALDYMNGQSDYHNVSGDGDIQRYGAWFYSTWLSDSGHYADFVLKYGHLKNDFDIYTPEGYNVTGDYSNNVVSISGEYGYKFANAAGWFAEPQVQLQYSYVSEADYTTSQGTKVEVDSIDSLIARAGVRLGKDFNAEYPISLYLRADVLHEFLGDQDLSAIDESRIDVTYENDDTWYSAGVGLSVMTSPDTYFFIEGEQVFGADNDDTYTLSGGFRHNF